MGMDFKNYMAFWCAGKLNELFCEEISWEQFDRVIPMLKDMRKNPFPGHIGDTREEDVMLTDEKEIAEYDNFLFGIQRFLECFCSFQEAGSDELRDVLRAYALRVKENANL